MSSIVATHLADGATFDATIAKLLDSLSALEVFFKNDMRYINSSFTLLYFYFTCYCTIFCVYRCMHHQAI